MDILRITTLAITTLISQTAAADILYDLAPANNAAPFETVLIADSSIQTPSSINAGELEVNQNFNNLTGNWVVFNTPTCGSYDQIKFDLPLDQEEIYVSANIYIEGQSGSDNVFSMSIDSSGYGARSFQVHGLGMFRLFNFGGSNFTGYSSNRVYKVELYANTTNDVLAITVDGEEIHRGTFGSSDIRSVRLTQSPWTGSASDCGNSTVAINDLKIYEEPADVEVHTNVFDINFELLESNIIPKNGTRLPYLRTITNNDLLSRQKQISWASLELPTGEHYTLRKHLRNRVISAGDTFIENSSLRIPKWIPAGDYELTYYVMNIGDSSVQKTSVSISKQE